MYNQIIAENKRPTNSLHDFLYTAEMPETKTAKAWDKRLSRLLPPRLRQQPVAWLSLGFWLMVLVVVAVRFWNLRGLQNEVYGDITTVYLYVNDVLTGRWPFYFSLSAGPLYEYLVFPITWLFGPQYFGLKLASVATSLSALLFTYLFARRLLGRGFAILATFIAGISFWLLIFSRLGNFPIIVPLLSSAVAWLMLRYAQERKTRDLYAAMTVAMLGLYAYPGAYVLPLVVIASTLMLQRYGIKVRPATWLRTAALMIVLSLPFAWMVSQSTSMFASTGYFGNKLAFGIHALLQLGRNVLHALGAYNFKGDITYRTNVGDRPHLDAVSGVLLWLGVWFWLQKPRQRDGWLILISFVMLHLPSMLVLSNDYEVPSTTRSLGAAPFAYVLAASGLWQLAAWLRPRIGRIVTIAASAILIAAITALNLKSYFVDYISQLPYENTPIARQITDYMDNLAPETQVYLVGCCWEQSMPEPMAIQFEVKRPENFHHIQPDELQCRGLDAVLSPPAVLIWNYKDDLPTPQLEDCAERFPALLFAGSTGLPTFHAAVVQGLHALEVEEDMHAQWLTVDNRLVLARYSLLDTGRIEDAFDDNPTSLMRGLSANPFILEFEFDEPQPMAGVDVTLAAVDHFSLTAVVSYADGSTAELGGEYDDLPADPTVMLEFPESGEPVASLHIEIFSFAPRPSDGFHIHIREIQLNFAE